MEAIKKTTIKDKQIHNMNEFAQTDMEKGIADSAPEAPVRFSVGDTDRQTDMAKGIADSAPEAPVRLTLTW